MKNEKKNEVCVCVCSVFRCIHVFFCVPSSSNLSIVKKKKKRNQAARASYIFLTTMRLRGRGGKKAKEFLVFF